MLKRRSFLAGILAAATAPAIVRAESLMKLPAPLGFSSTGLVLMPNVYPMEIGRFEGILFHTDDGGATWAAEPQRAIQQSGDYTSLFLVSDGNALRWKRLPAFPTTS